MRKMYRQGDVLLIKQEDTGLVDGQTAETDVLLEGSITGHHHRIKNGKIYFKQNRSIFAYILAETDCKLTHEEHNTIEIPEGVYEARRQREVSGYVED